MPTRNIPVQHVQAGLQQRLAYSLAENSEGDSIPAADEAALNDIVSVFDGVHLSCAQVLGATSTLLSCLSDDVPELHRAHAEQKLKDSGLTARGRLLQGSLFSFTAGPEGQLSAEGALVASQSPYSHTSGMHTAIKTC